MKDKDLVKKNIKTIVLVLIASFVMALNIKTFVRAGDCSPVDLQELRY